MKSLSVVIPIYNEKESLPELFSRLVKTCAGYDPFEIICVDDGSTDGSFEKLCDLKKEYLKMTIIKFSENAGQAAALAAGLKAARGDVVVTLDADLQNPPEAIPLLLKHIEGVDAVVGWRKKRRDSFLRRWGSFIANTVRRLILKDSFHDNGCALKAFRRDAIADIVWFKRAFSFLPDLIQIAGYKVREIEVPHEERRHGRSKYPKMFFSGIAAFADTLLVLALKKRRIVYHIEKVV